MDQSAVSRRRLEKADTFNAVVAPTPRDATFLQSGIDVAALAAAVNGTSLDI